MVDTVKHTPGPWRVGESHSLLVFDSTKEGWAVADARTYHGRIAHKEAEANARLIAAAPEMLEALNAIRMKEEWVVGAQGGDIVLRVPLSVIQQIAAAIAKAEGRS